MSKKILIIAIMATLMFCVSSCCTSNHGNAPAPAAGATATGSYKLGRYTNTVGATLFEANQAILSAARNGKLIQLSRVNRETSVAYEYKDIYDNRISVLLTGVNDTTSRISIKVGKTGNRTFSQNFMALIESELQNSSAAPLSE